MIYLLLVFIVSAAGAFVARRTGGGRWCVVAGTAVGLVAGIVNATRSTLFLAENGFWLAFLVFGLPSMLAGLCAGLATRAATRSIVE